MNIIYFNDNAFGIDKTKLRGNIWHEKFSSISIFKLIPFHTSYYRNDLSIISDN